MIDWDHKWEVSTGIFLLSGYYFLVAISFQTSENPTVGETGPRNMGLPSMTDDRSAENDFEDLIAAIRPDVPIALR